jgi:lipid-binding SYLF domain-containing protein
MRATEIFPMKKIAVVVLLTVCATLGWAQDRDKVMERVDAAGTVMNEIMDAPDKGIPEEILGSAQCVAVVPSLLKGGFIVGASYGKGVASCKTANGWSAPAFFRVEGGSVGFQIGGQAVDLVMVIMNERGMRALLSSKFKLGADASVAAGPVGRHAEGATDWKMRAQVLTYSRARGVFAGISLNGAVIKQDRDDTRAFYGRMVPYRTLLTGAHPAPPDANPYLETLRRYAPVKAAAEAPKATTPAAEKEKQ